MQLLVSAALAGWLAIAGPAAAASYVVSIQGARAGTMELEQDGDSTRVAFRWLDNGRGPEMKERFRVGDGALPVDYEVRGNTIFGGTIGEQFTIADGRVRWTSPSDRGDEAAEPGRLFLPLESTPAYWGQMLRALLARPGLRAPAGGAAVLAAERLTQLQVDGADGPVPVTLYAVTGGDMRPWYLWLRDDATRALFGVVWPGWFLTPAGYEGAGAVLLQRQREAEDDWLRGVRQRAVRPLPGLTLIRGVRWFDAAAAEARGPSDVYLADGRIAAVTAPGALQAAPQQTIDGAGATLLPGLFDMHAHIGPVDALLHLAAGVTTVRDMGNQNADLWRLKARIDDGLFAGPHIVPAGFIEGESPFSARNGFVVADLEAGLRAVDWYAARGYRQIKLYNSIRPAWVKPLAARAHHHGMTVAGHVPAFMRAEQAVRAGYDELTHINQVMLNFLVTPADDTRTLRRFELVAEQARRVAPGGEAAQRFIRLLRQRGTTVDPTLATFEAMFTQRDGEPNPSLRAVAEHLPVLWRRGLLASEMSPNAEQVGRWRASYERMLGFVGAMHRAGVPLVAGTDGTPGLMLFRELELYVRAGIPAPQALRVATRNGAHVAGVGASTGAIRPGFAADLVLVDGDPTRNIADLRRTRLVVKGREAYAPAALYEALGMRGFAPPAIIETAPTDPDRRPPR